MRKHSPIQYNSTTENIAQCNKSIIFAISVVYLAIVSELLLLNEIVEVHSKKIEGLNFKIKTILISWIEKKSDILQLDQSLITTKRNHRILPKIV